MNVLYSATRNYYPYLTWTVRSLMEFNDARIFVFAEDDRIPCDFPCEVINVSKTDRFSRLNVSNRYTIMSLVRVLAPVLLPVDKVLYLDVDTIVADSMQEMYDTDMTDKWIAWVKEKGYYNPYDRDYFNFGVALMNLEQMRKDQVSERLVELLNTRKFTFGEQDAMNLIAEGHQIALPRRYNESQCTGTTDNPAIVHFAGISQWFQSNSMYRSEYRDKYMR